MFREVLHLIKPVASIKKLLITLNLTPDVPECDTGDEKRLMQVILNIVGNAVKFSKEKSIAVTAFVAKAEFLRDSREPDFIPEATDNNFYLQVQVCKPYGSLEGNIWIESEGLGKGCTAIFVVKLGISERPKEAMILFSSKQLASPMLSTFLGLKVLVMDENGVSRAVTKGLLMHLGCDVTTVASSQECLSTVSRELKVVFLDVCMCAWSQWL